MKFQGVHKSFLELHSKNGIRDARWGLELRCKKTTGYIKAYKASIKLFRSNPSLPNPRDPKLIFKKVMFVLPETGITMDELYGALIVCVFKTSPQLLEFEEKCCTAVFLTKNCSVGYETSPDFPFGVRMRR